MRLLLFVTALAYCMLTHHPLAAASEPDTVRTILNSKGNKLQKQKQLIQLCYSRFLRSGNYDNIGQAMADSVVKYRLGGAQELQDFAQILIYRREFDLEKADRLLNRAIARALQHAETVFLHQFYLNRAFVQTDMGSELSAIHNYRMARKVAEELNNPDLLITTDIGISDIYLGIDLYAQALAYLDFAQDTYNRQRKRNPYAQATIYMNKAENYFKMNNLDSLRHYAALTKSLQNDDHEMNRSLKRLEYDQLILEKKEELAIPLIKELLSTGKQYYRYQDQWQLANCYYQIGQLDSAMEVAQLLVAAPALNSSNIKLKSYQLIAKILIQKNDIKQANHFLELAFDESEKHKLKLLKVGDVSSELHLDRVEAGYNARNLIYEKERTILIMAVIAAILALIVIVASYRNTRQKNNFQKLLHEARSKELAFINSHQVRRPLANILGVCNLIDGQQPTESEMLQYIHLIQHEAKEIDDKLTDVEKKLSASSI